MAGVSPPIVPGEAAASLTYEPFYGLRDKPFSLSADPRLLFRSQAHAPAFDALLAGIRRREGLIVLTGEIGSGKTIVCRSVLQHLDRRTFAAFVPDPLVSCEDLLKTLLVDFGVLSIRDVRRALNRTSRFDLRYLLCEFLDSLVPLQAYAVLVIDEAQKLTLPLLEEIRILSELEGRETLLQVVLVGRPELRANLLLPEMRHIEQRVSVRHELTPLDAAEVGTYVHHRLRVVSEGESCVQFSPDSLHAIHQASSGVPRVINYICDRALHQAYVSRAFLIEPRFVAAALRDLGLDTGTPTAASSPRPISGTEVVLDRPPLENEPSVPLFLGGTGAPIIRSASPPRVSRRWRMPTAAALVVVATAAGAGLVGLRSESLNAAAIAAVLPPPPALPLRQVAMPREPEEASLPESPTAPANGSASAQREEYLIQAGWFANRDRAENRVVELTTAGYRARAIAHDLGPSRGRRLQVIVGGYSSALEVERDLRRIRELPGYGDSHLLLP